MNYNDLFQKIGELSVKYSQEKELNSGFNIFEVLNIQNKEVTLHSNFISYLLNPAADHKKGKRFLELFLSGEAFSKMERNGLEKALVYTEYAIGASKETDDYGRIDILVKILEKSVIAIENKIYASDQPKQLERYFNFLENNYKETDKYLIYLTLTGNEPSSSSLGELKQNQILKVSYEKDILPWLSECLKEVIFDPALRETIQQYATAIKNLLNLKERMKSVMELKEELRKFKDIDFGLLDKSIQELKVEAMASLMEEILLRLKAGSILKVFRDVEYEITDELIRKYVSRNLSGIKQYVGIAVGINSDITLAIYIDHWKDNEYMTYQFFSSSIELNKKFMSEEMKGGTGDSCYKYYRTDINFKSTDFKFKIFLDDNEEGKEFIEGLFTEIKEVLKDKLPLKD